MRVEALAVRLRSRSQMEAADLGVSFCQSLAGPVYRCYAVVAVPVIALALASYQIADWLPTIVIWCAKPWLDRTILFVLSRAAFRQDTRVSDLWRAQRDVWWSQLLFTWSIRRLSLWRAFTQPVYQLEGGTLREAGARVRQLRRRHSMSALMVTHAFSMAEIGLTVSLLSLVFWFAPSGVLPGVETLFDGPLLDLLSTVLPICYAIAVFVIEPFYVAAGFTMYLNRRTQLEAWDIEQEFRRAFVH